MTNDTLYGRYGKYIDISGKGKGGKVPYIKGKYSDQNFPPAGEQNSTGGGKERAGKVIDRKRGWGILAGNVLDIKRENMLE